MSVDHYWISVEDRTGAVAVAGDQDQPLTGMLRLQTYRVRFQVSNAGSVPVTLAPSLQAGLGAAPASWTSVPTDGITLSEPFYIATDYHSVVDAKEPSMLAADLKLKSNRDPAAKAADGQFVTRAKPATPVTLAPHTFTELEFIVRAGPDAAWLTTYALRLDLGVKDPIAQVNALVAISSAPPVDLSPGQQTGVEAAATGPAYPLTQPSPSGGIRLASAIMTPLGGAAPLDASSFTSPHNEITITGDSCAACHRSHSAEGQMLLVTQAAPMSRLCFMCHDGTGANSNVKAEVATPPIPANNALTSSYYSHPVTASVGPNVDAGGDFAGTLNRRAQCQDCHQPHLATSASGTVVTPGSPWTAGGAISAASGVAVTNQPVANSTPTYALLTSSQYEYQLCFKCHSGYTTLLTKDPAHPSRWALDKAVEFNPANVAYHPVEAAGKNQTSQMVLSLSDDPAETSPYKIWSWTKATDTSVTATIRCENCHGTNTTGSAVPAGSMIDNHASVNRSILLRNYRDRVLLGPTENYSPSDSALCLVCHAQSPFVDVSFTPLADSNFMWHGYHLNYIGGISAPNPPGGNAADWTNIDAPGAGQGNALCSECHFRTHGSSFPAGTQDSGPGLVNFAPDVQPYKGVIQIIRKDGGNAGSCTLRCHGVDHDAFPYY